MPSSSEHARAILEEIRQLYPDLASSYAEHDDGCGFEVAFPEQPGLSFSFLTFFREDDTLQLELANFCAEYFPCGEPEVSSRFFDAACGLIEGRYRVLQIRRNGRLLKAILQVPAGSGWTTEYTHYQSFWIPWPWIRYDEEAVQNVAAV